MTDKSMRNTELVSALVDGQLRGDEFSNALAQLDASSEARQSWHAYHVLGDVMRTGQSTASAKDADFVMRLRARLQQEAAPLALHPAGDLLADNARVSDTQARTAPRLVSANDNAWRLVVGLASVAVVGVMAWQGFQDSGSQGAQLATAPVAAPATAAQPAPSSATLASMGDLSATPSRDGAGKNEPTVSAAPVMIRDPQLDALLAAHRQFGGTSALQMPTGFLRNATFEEGAR
ncbi:sigma-E factor negative regulatory protein [Rhodoferax sp.]|uniref:sigma-E factor negative regulatory protein n=1 Tax=Rhodoferax sp. TaxID=50421 RepID=UPI0025CFF563|nr:sigma-E factor negative regulatory protein [Rhodoferax sp.]